VHLRGRQILPPPNYRRNISLAEIEEREEVIRF
jgi:hypothetical protein